MRRSAVKSTFALIAAAMLTPLTAVVVAAQAKPPVAPTEYNNACRTCHSIREGDHRVGPSLHGIFGAKAGQRQGFQSSGAMKNSGLTWNEQTLDRFIENPTDQPDAECHRMLRHRFSARQISLRPSDRMRACLRYSCDRSSGAVNGLEDNEFQAHERRASAP